MILVFALVFLALLLIFRHSPLAARITAGTGLIVVAGWYAFAARELERRRREGIGNRRVLSYDLARYVFGVICAVALAAVAFRGGIAQVPRAALITLVVAVVAAYLVVVGTAISSGRAARRRH